MQWPELDATAWKTAAGCPTQAAYQIHDLLEVNSHASDLQVAVVCGLVDELGHLTKTQLSSKAKQGSARIQQYFQDQNECGESQHCTCLARLPKTNSMASMTLDFPLPFGPTTDEKLCTPASSYASLPRNLPLWCC